MKPNSIHAHTAAAAVVFTVAVTVPATADNVHMRQPRGSQTPGTTFTRMFPDLPAFIAQSQLARDAANQIGAKGRLMDARDKLTDPVQSIVNQPEFSPDNLDNPDMTAGVTFFGQFLDHDITLDRRSPLQEGRDPTQTVNSRTAAFDLDSVYGGGPLQQPELYRQSRRDIKFIVEKIPGSARVARGKIARFDLPRNQLGEAIIGDSRNDENVIIAQLHLAMLKFHNAVTDQLAVRTRKSAREIFAEAKQLVQWHYQWIILHEFLPQTIGQERVNELLRTGQVAFPIDGLKTQDWDFYARRGGQKQYREKHVFAKIGRKPSPQIPIEFAVAAYRFGHSQVRPSYRLNFGASDDSQFFAFILDNKIDPNSADPDDLRGGRRAPRRFVDWQTFFDFGDGNVRNNKRIDTRISSNLFELPGTAIPAPGLPSDGEMSLPSRNLMRHVNFGVPSGQSIATQLNLPVLTPEQLVELAPFGMAESTPLWYYILKEAELLEDGRRLGPLGARIVGEVFIGLLRADPTSFVNVAPEWVPTLPSQNGHGEFRVVDLLNFAGVVVPLN